MAGHGPFSKSFDDLNFTDNYMFCKVLQQNTELCKKMLEILLHMEIKEVKVIESEKPIENFYNSKGVRLDLYVKNDDESFDIEMQTCNYENLILRAVIIRVPWIRKKCYEAPIIPPLKKVT